MRTSHSQFHLGSQGRALSEELAGFGAAVQSVGLAVVLGFEKDPLQCTNAMSSLGMDTPLARDPSASGL